MSRAHARSYCCFDQPHWWSCRPVHVHTTSLAVLTACVHCRRIGSDTATLLALAHATASIIVVDWSFSRTHTCIIHTHTVCWLFSRPNCFVVGRAPILSHLSRTFFARAAARFRICCGMSRAHAHTHTCILCWLFLQPNLCHRSCSDTLMSLEYVLRSSCIKIPNLLRGESYSCPLPLKLRLFSQSSCSVLDPLRCCSFMRPSRCSARSILLWCSRVLRRSITCSCSCSLASSPCLLLILSCSSWFDDPLAADTLVCGPSTIISCLLSAMDRSILTR